MVLLLIVDPPQSPRHLKQPLVEPVVVSCPVSLSWRQYNYTCQLFNRLLPRSIKIGGEQKQTIRSGFASKVKICFVSCFGYHIFIHLTNQDTRLLCTNCHIKSKLLFRQNTVYLDICRVCSADVAAMQDKETMCHPRYYMHPHHPQLALPLPTLPHPASFPQTLPCTLWCTLTDGSRWGGYRAPVTPGGEWGEGGQVGV